MIVGIDSRVRDNLILFAAQLRLAALVVSDLRSTRRTLRSECLHRVAVADLAGVDNDTKLSRRDS
jgi:hypothetical protein